VSYYFPEDFPYRQTHMIWWLHGIWQYLRGDMGWRPMKSQGINPFASTP
jgi:hypothetical protein